MCFINVTTSKGVPWHTRVSKISGTASNSALEKQQAEFDYHHKKLELTSIPSE